MNFKVMWTAFTTLFLAEFGDKTQLAVLSLVAATKQPLAVFLGAMGAFAAITGLAVVFGQGLSRVIPGEWLEKAGAVAFIVIGILMLVKKG